MVFSHVPAYFPSSRDHVEERAYCDSNVPREVGRQTACLAGQQQETKKKTLEKVPVTST